jgi:Ca2+-binding RTX toxin-like protein
MSRRSTLMLLISTAALAIPAGVAGASTVSSDGTTATFQSGNRASDVTTDSRTRLGGSEFTDARQTLVAGEGCEASTPVFCRGPLHVDIRLGRGDDRVRSWNFSEIRVNGAGGDDDLDASGNVTWIWGGTGEDRIVASSNIRAFAFGGDDDDRIRSQFGIEANLHGEDDDDLVVGTRFFNTVRGGRGDDDVFALNSGTGSVAGDSGDDAIALLGDGFGPYELTGGSGDDVIEGGPGADTVAAGSGDDRVDVFGDGGNDTVDCGTGFDRVSADPEDVVARNCERVVAGPTTSWRLLWAHFRLAKAFPDLAPRA